MRLQGTCSKGITAPGHPGCLMETGPRQRCCGGPGNLAGSARAPSAVSTRTGQTACNVCTARQMHRLRWCARQKQPMPVPKPGRKARDGKKKEVGRSRPKEAGRPSGRAPVMKALMKTKSERKWQMPMVLCCRSTLRTWQGSRRRMNRQREPHPLGREGRGESKTHWG